MSAILLVENVPREITDDDVRQVFSRFGRVVAVEHGSEQLSRALVSYRVEMLTAEEARKALTAFAAGSIRVSLAPPRA